MTEILVKIGIGIMALWHYGIMALAAIAMVIMVIYGAYKADEESNKNKESYFD